MQFKVPQNIDKEDQIVGPLTLVEFSYLAIGGALDILINQTVQGALKFPVMLLISLIALAFTFLKVQDRPLLFFVIAAIDYLMQPKVRVWHKMNDAPIVHHQRPASDKTGVAVPKKAYDPSKIEQLTQVLDARGHTTAAPAAPAPQVFANVDATKL